MEAEEVADPPSNSDWVELPSPRQFSHVEEEKETTPRLQTPGCSSISQKHSHQTLSFHVIDVTPCAGCNFQPC